MNRHQFLTSVHQRLQPRSYLEIGVNDGRGLARSSTRTIGVDPAFVVRVELACDLKLVKATSDDFFARPDAISWFPEGVVDLTFIDGLHLFEVALRDFMNAERLSSPSSVIIFDDVLPRSVAEAARDRHTREWTGDVFKVMAVLERYRPDLTLIPIDTAPTGLLVVLGLDPTSKVLAEHYDEIMQTELTGDPQHVPDEVLHRRTAADPYRVLDSPIWAELAAARDEPGPVADIEKLRTLRGTARFTLAPPQEEPWPPKKAAPPAPEKQPAPKQPAQGDLRADLTRDLRRLGRALARRARRR
jgi:hypothetical protein